MDRSGIWHVDKKAILQRMTEYAEPYRLCPAFSWERALAGLAGLPETINPRKDPEWALGAGGVVPRSRSVVASYTINVDLNPEFRKRLSPPAKAKARGCGCSTLSVLLGIATLVGLLLVR